MIIAIFPNVQKESSREIAKNIQEFLSKKNVTVVADDPEAKRMGAIPLSSIAPDSLSFLLSLGGDGSILQIAHKYAHLQAPILGINLGHLGFMADIPIPDLYPSLQELLDGNFTIDDRIVIEGATSRQERCFGVNDIVLHRASNPGLIELSIHVDGRYLNTFEADGLVIATPNGSTAYSLAAGGPIISPTTEAIVITPISPHTISNRPIVLRSSQEIQIEYLSSYPSIEVQADGIAKLPLASKDVLHIKRSDKTFRLVRLKKNDYFTTLRTKLGWHGKLRVE